MRTISLSPVSRIEGHLAVHTETEPVTVGGATVYRVTNARCEGEMFRGLEKIMEGRDPLDAQVIMQRVTSASVRSLQIRCQPGAAG
jgi:hydrogenase large subunit